MAPADEGARSVSECVVVLAPTARDADVTQRLLSGAHLDAVVAQDWLHVVTLLRDGVGALLLTDTALADPGFAALLNALESQPAWSNLPVLMLCRKGLESPVLREARLRNLTLLDRPTSTRALLSAVRTALRGRRWQYQIREQIDALLTAERALRLADQRKDEFLATLAHELRNPLAPIRSGVQLLADGPPLSPDRHRSLAHMMDRQMRQLLRLIDDLLEVSRISTGKLVLRREKLDLRRTVEMALEASQPLIERGRHRVSVDLPQEEVWVDGDPTRLAQALSNLLNNASKYTPDGGRITVGLARAGDTAVLAVQDSGVGIPAETIAHVFDMFTQVNGSLERSQGGLGIGLALVKRLVALHGGRVCADSAGPGQGSRFTIKLPLLAPQPQGTAPGPEPAPAVADALRILVVDDNDDAALSLAMLLEVSGHAVAVEHSGEAGLQRAAAFGPQVILCDLGMPGMSGYEFARHMRQDPRFASTLLVALTGWGAEEDKKRSRAAGFDVHLTKPVGIDAVSSVLGSVASAG